MPFCVSFWGLGETFPVYKGVCAQDRIQHVKDWCLHLKSVSHPSLVKLVCDTYIVIDLFCFDLHEPLSNTYMVLCASLHPLLLTHWGRVTHICISKLTIIGSDNGLSPDWRQAIIWTNAGLLLIGPLGANFSEILIEILTLSFKKMRLKVSSAKRRPFCLGLNVLTHDTR